MSTNQSTLAVGVFQTREQAASAVEDLRQAGFSDEQIGFAMRQPDAPATTQPVAAEQVVTEGATELGTGAAAGAVSGGVLGGLVGAAAALLIPGFGPVLAGGLLMATLGGAAVGAAAGGLLGFLVGRGVSETEARYYQGEFESGRAIVTVQADGRWEEAHEILRRNGGYNASDAAAPGQ